MISIIVLIIPLIVIFFFTDDPLTLVSEYGLFFPLGLIGALAANSTGAGGGIVFIPVFASLGVTDLNSLGTSLSIQCFGMSAGSISWLMSIRMQQHGGESVIRLTNHLLVLAGIFTVVGMLFAQYVLPPPDWPVYIVFKYFSIVFGAILLFVTLKRKIPRRIQYHVRRRDKVLIAVACFSGGLITSWISVGVGELLAILLFLLGYPTMITVCVAVCISAMAVLSGIPYHIWVVESIVWQILLFAAPAAIIGGFIARLVSERLGPIKLKVFFSVWVLITGLVM